MSVNTAVRLDIENITKVHNNYPIMEDITFRVHAGEIFVLAGVRGSGKSLLSKIIVSLTRKDGGTVKVDGTDTSKKFHETLSKIGAVTQNQAFYGNISGFKTVLNISELNMRPVSRAAAANIMKLLGLRSVMHLPVARYTKTQLQLLKIAAAAAGRPSLLLLDEPFQELSTEQAHTARFVLKSAADNFETAIFITSPTLDGVQDFCDTIAIIDDGMIVQIKSYNQMLRDDTPASKISISTLTPNLTAKLIDENLNLPVALCGTDVIVTTPPANAQKVVNMLNANGIKVLGAQRVNRPMNELFFEAIQRKRPQLRSGRI